MDGEKRRAEIIELLKKTKTPLSGSQIAGLLNVSRQVIVQDIALLRAARHEILSTSSGYLLHSQSMPQRVFKVVHDDKSTLDELFTIVDLGGQIIDVQIQHQRYGNFSAVLNIKSRRDAEKLMQSISAGTCTPLKNLTNNRHCHLVQAETTEDLDAIEDELQRKGYLCKD